MNVTVMNVIHDCRDQVHFSRKLLEHYWSTLDTNVKEMMNLLGEDIFDQFIRSIGKIDIPSDMDLLVQFVNQTNGSTIPMIVEKIETDLAIIEGYFEKINGSNSTLPSDLVQTTSDEVSL